jgi:hypothetical protein
MIIIIQKKIYTNKNNNNNINTNYNYNIRNSKNTSKENIHRIKI